MSTNPSGQMPAPRLQRVPFLPPQTEGYGSLGRLAEDFHVRAVPALPEAEAALELAATEPAPAADFGPSRFQRTASRVRAVRWSAVVLAVVLVGVEAVIAAESFGGLVDFAHLIHITGRAAYGVPVTLDGVGLAAALMALRAELSGESSAMPRVALFAFTGASTAANWWAHQAEAAAALYYGGMSLAVAFMFALVVRQLRAEDRRRARLVSDRLPKLSLPLWLRYPDLAWSALSLAILRGYRTPRDAIDAAIAAKEAKRAAKLPALDLDGEALAALSPRDRLVVAFGAVGSIDVPKALALLDRHGSPVDQSHAYQIRKALAAGKDGQS